MVTIYLHDTYTYIQYLIACKADSFLFHFLHSAQRSASEYVMWGYDTGSICSEYIIGVVGKRYIYTSAQNNIAS